MKTLEQPVREEIEYPESDGEPLGENSLQVDWIVLLYNGLEAQYRDVDDVVVSADLFWYPVEGDPKTVTAADVMVVFDRPRRPRPSYMQWREEGVAPQVTIEVCSPSNSKKNLRATFEFYDRFGVEEYYLIDPVKDTLQGWQRKGGRLKKIKSMAGWVSPRLGIRFQPERDGLHVFGVDGREFLMPREQARLIAHAESKLREAEAERRLAEAQQKKAQADKQQAEETRRKLAEKLRELGVDPDSL